VLYREPKLLKALLADWAEDATRVSVLYREPKLLKEDVVAVLADIRDGFSALP